MKEIQQLGQQAALVWVKGKQAYTAVVVDSQGEDKDSTVMEQAAIALAIRNQKWTRIYSDSKEAIKSFDKGYVADKLIDKVEIRWFPAHMGHVDETRVSLNEVTNDMARTFACRARPTTLADPEGKWLHWQTMISSSSI